ncbi:MAG: hypothetical protein LBS83_03120 [Holosporales bacterium]|nr:hypothetical protein [Holosporales bacterium]
MNKLFKKNIFFAFWGCFSCNNAESVYIGVSTSGNFVFPKIYWTNPVSKWLEDDMSKFSAALEDYYGNAGRDPEKKEEYFNNLFLTLNNVPEKVLIDSWKKGIGAAFWIGNGKKLKDNFYIGCEVSFEYSNVKIKELSEKQPLLDFSDITFFSRHGFKGAYYFATDILCSRNFSVGGYLRLGFFPLKKFMMYLKGGVGINQCFWEKFGVTSKNNVKIIRYDDIGNQVDYTKNIFGEIPEITDYAVTGREYFFSINMGLGFEYNLPKNYFIRTEYEFKFGFSNKIKLPSKQKIDFNNPKFEYAFKYHSVENCIFLGIGRRL